MKRAAQAGLPLPAHPASHPPPSSLAEGVGRMVNMNAVVTALNFTTITPLWPAPRFQLACPNSTPQASCNLLGSTTECFEPEAVTQEVLSSFLYDCYRRSCTYIDIGCNIGYFAAHAHALGSRVECFEPTPPYAKAIRKSRSLNGGAETSWLVHRVAVVSESTWASRRGAPMRFSHAYIPCGNIGRQALRKARAASGPGGWSAPLRRIDEIIRQQNVTLLKIDTDGWDGALLADVEAAIARKHAIVESIIVEVGDSQYDAWCEVDPSVYDSVGKPAPKTPAGCRKPSKRPRGLPYPVIWRFIHEHGYDVYRLNTHTAREIFDWRGVNVNRKLDAEPRGLQSLFGVRTMRKLERLLPETPVEDYPSHFLWGQSFLITRVPIVAYATHQELDVVAMQRVNRLPRTWGKFQSFLNNGSFVKPK